MTAPHLGQYDPTPEVGDHSPRNGNHNGTALLDKFRIQPRMTDGPVQPLPIQETLPAPPQPDPPPTPEQPEQPEKTTSTTPATPTGQAPTKQSGWDEFWLAMAARTRTRTDLKTAKAKAKAARKSRKKAVVEIDTRIGNVAYGVIMTLAGIVAILAFILSFTMMKPAAELYGWKGWQASLFPIIIDVGAVGGTIMGAISAHPVYQRSGRQVLALTLLASVMFNLVGHGLGEKNDSKNAPNTPKGDPAPPKPVPKGSENAAEIPSGWGWTGTVAAILIPVLLAYFIHVASTATKTFVDQRRDDEKQRKLQQELDEEEARRREEEEAKAERLRQETEQRERAAQSEADRMLSATQPLTPVAAPINRVPTPRPEPATPKPQPEPKRAAQTSPAPKEPAGGWTVDNITEFEFRGSLTELAASHKTELGLIVQRIKREDERAGRELGVNKLSPMFGLPVRLFREIHRSVRDGQHRNTTP